VPRVNRPDCTALAVHAARLAGTRLTDLFDQDPGRPHWLCARLGPLLLDLSRQPVDAGAWQALLQFAAAAGVEQARSDLLSGQAVNRSEQRAALHPALRTPALAAAAGIGDRVAAALVRTLAIATDLRERPAAFGLARVTDVVSIGIGGSDLGPRLACQALAGAAGPGPRLHFLANVDGGRTAALRERLDPATTVAILVSKSFATEETLLNGRAIRDWLAAALGADGADARLFAVSANTDAAAAFGIAAERVLPMWDFVGGRYSVWSAVGLPLAVAIGAERFQAFLDGARAMDEHFAQEPLADNLPVRLALAGFWNRDFMGRTSLCVVPYDDRLAALPEFLQQLEMESNGKQVGPDGAPVPLPTVPVLWGSVGSNAQHAYFQALHQGCDVVPVDFIGVIRPDHDLADNHRALLANLLAQGAALMQGKPFQAAWDELAGVADADERNALAAQKTFPGNRPSTTILLDRLDPYALGMLLALYEHKVFVQSVLWGVNAFDQWGVELGKTLAGRIGPVLAGGDAAGLDPATRHLVGQIRERGGPAR
jgi:glucose-6-phosphate isomerase